MLVESAVTYTNENAPEVANDLTKTLLDYAKDKTISGYFLIQNKSETSYSVSIIEWTDLKKEEDLRKCLLDSLLEQSIPFAVFSAKVLGTKRNGDIQTRFGASLLDWTIIPEGDLDALMNTTLDKYCEDFQQRVDTYNSAV